MGTIYLSVVIPVYNTTEVLKILTDKLHQSLKRLSKPYEIIFVNDRSSNPKTLEILKELSLQDNVKVALFTKNFGQQAATLCGLALSQGTYVVTMDDDLQHDPFDIPKLIEAADKYDIIIGQFRSKKHFFFKRVTSKIKEQFDVLILGKPKGIQLSAFRLLTRPVVNGILKIKTPTPFISAMMLYVSKNIKSVDLQHHERAEGHSGYSFMSLIKLFSYLLINNSSLLLRLIGRIGVCIFVISLLFLGYLLLRFFIYGIAVQGWTSVIVSIFFFGGIQLFTLGVIGEYLIRIINYSEQRPAYFIERILS